MIRVPTLFFCILSCSVLSIAQADNPASIARPQSLKWCCYPERVALQSQFNDENHGHSSHEYENCDTGGNGGSGANHGNQTNALVSGVFSDTYDNWSSSGNDIGVQCERIQIIQNCAWAKTTDPQCTYMANNVNTVGDGSLNPNTPAAS